VEAADAPTGAAAIAVSARVIQRSLLKKIIMALGDNYIRSYYHPMQGVCHWHGGQ